SAPSRRPVSGRRRVPRGPRGNAGRRCCGDRSGPARARPCPAMRAMGAAETRLPADHPTLRGALSLLIFMMRKSRRRVEFHSLHFPRQAGHSHMAIEMPRTLGARASLPAHRVSKPKKEAGKDARAPVDRATFAPYAKEPRPVEGSEDQKILRPPREKVAW